MRRLLYTLLLTYWAACFAWYPKLPDRYPIHFNARGQPDGWSQGPFGWFLLPAIGTMTLLLLLGVGKLARRAPQLWNIPEKKRFLALSAEQRAPIESVLDGILEVAALYTLVVIATCQWAIYRSAVSARPGLPLLFHLVLWGGMAVLLMVVLKKNREVKEMIRATSAEASIGRTS